MCPECGVAAALGWLVREGLSEEVAKELGDMVQDIIDGP